MRTAIDTMLEHDAAHEADVKILQQALRLPRRDGDDGRGVGDFDAAGISDDAREAFESMLQIIRDRSSVLTTKQRAWVRNVLDENDITDERELNLVSRGLVPRGPEVETPAVLKNRPLAPPGGKRFNR